MTAVKTLRGEITAVLEAEGLSVIHDGELQNPVPSLERGEDLLPTGWPPDAPAIVRDAFFFVML